MKKIILAVIVVLSVTAGSSFAQKAYYNGYKPVPNSRTENRYDDDLNINKLDKIVGLTRKQENHIRKIENKYDHLAAGRYANLRELNWKKEQEIVNVLTASQRQRLYAFQNGHMNNKHNRRG